MLLDLKDFPAEVLHIGLMGLILKHDGGYLGIFRLL